MNVTCVAIGGKFILTWLTYSLVRLSIVNEQHDAVLKEKEEKEEEEEEERSILSSVDAAFRVWQLKVMSLKMQAKISHFI